ncbi:blastula protease 10-like [Penaeus japonicus]|uniref:blastula protease 10-like n=1 Tax=Penaeus japonicus TaxID=27405 RepID=UPI001C716EB2|nr:blastula protease 10-like [Penaeus japonicus]
MEHFWLILPLLVSFQVKAGSVAGGYKAKRNDTLPVFPPEGFHSEVDMMLTPEQEALLHGGRAEGSLTALWDDVDGFPLIPYAFIDHDVDRTPVLTAIHEWQASTCIRFVEVEPDHSGPHLRFQRHADDCMSHVGKVSATGQEVYISEGCGIDAGTLLRILGHAIGLWPEEVRSDRDSYIEVLYDNVLPDAVDHFTINADDTHGVPYDYCSIMHSHERIFTSNGKGTIATLDLLYKSSIGQGQELSHMDQLQANRMYQCSDKLLSHCSLDNDPCVNYGYLSGSCSCVCPDGTSGDFCETMTDTYHGTCLKPLSETITEPATVTSPSVSESLWDDPTEVRFSTVIQAPENHVIVLAFEEFDIYGRTAHSVSEDTSVDTCWYDSVEICTDDLYNGEWYCGTELQGQNITSTGNVMALHFLSRLNFKPGLRFTVHFEEESSPEMCTLYMFHGEDESMFTAMHWYSPSHPENYPNNDQCQVGPGSETAVGRTKVTFNEFDLAAGDQVVIENPFTEPVVYDGQISGDWIKIPSLHFLATFSSDSSLTGSGFWLTFESEVPGCYKDLVALSSEQTIKSPRYPDAPPPPGKQCEYRITAQDPTKRVQVYMYRFKVRDPSFMAVNLAGDALYNSTNVVKLQSPLSTNIFVSFGNVVRLFFQGSKNTLGYKIKYKQVE